ncbi:hypothetical protein GPECTOR_9g595 [Gonium pectorale]|uniref:Uncharacterized protein n=1 Tax=Gonium pectorale TaxID=33097 RepID=A0A150GRW0_GONPE|nr:hypothetical protein GPECTOR_9g595 [Gonium pectorale]|eukprot:KXZ52551.1 hypothetical protein GPECTOR_9g595 [Gonium pectorale]
MDPPPSERCRASPSSETATVTTTDTRSVPAVRMGPVTAEKLREHNSLFSSLLKEYAYFVEDDMVTGTIPPELTGTYYRNGPGLQIDNPRYRRHTFDGDGMILSLSFKDGRAYFRNRFVRTEGFVKEQAAGRPLFRNSFTRGSADGSLFFNPFDLSFKNVANTGVLSWAGQLYALWEGGLPYRMDPVTLETRGESRMGGALRGNTFGAHYRVTAERDGSRRWVAFSAASGFGGASITFYEFAEDGRMLHETAHPLEGVSMAFVHDMLVSEHYYIIVLGPVEFDGAKFLTSYMLSQCSIAECLVYQGDKPARVVLVPRPGRPSGKVLAPRVLETQPCFVFHHLNAFEAERPGAPAVGGGGPAEPLVVVDTVAWDSVSFSVNQYTYGPEYYNGGSRSHMVRLVCDPAAGTVASHRLLRRTVEFPVADPRVVGRPHSLAWAGCDMVDHPLHWGPNQGIVRLAIDERLGLRPAAAGGGKAAADARVLSSPEGTAEGVAADVWFAGERCFVGEPQFVPRPGSTAEGDGWLLAAVHNAETQRGEVVILDAQDLSAGPVATIRLPHRLPAGLHGSWDAAYTGPADGDEVPRWQELGTIRPL